MPVSRDDDTRVGEGLVRATSRSECPFHGEFCDPSPRAGEGARTDRPARQLERILVNGIGRLGTLLEMVTGAAFATSMTFMISTAAHG